MSLANFPFTRGAAGSHRTPSSSSQCDGGSDVTPEEHLNLVVRLDLRVLCSGRGESNQNSSSCKLDFQRLTRCFSDRRWSSDTCGAAPSHAHLTIRTESVHGGFLRDSAWSVHEMQSVPRHDRGSMITHRQIWTRFRIQVCINIAAQPRTNGDSASRYARAIRYDTVRYDTINTR